MLLSTDIGLLMLKDDTIANAGGTIQVDAGSTLDLENPDINGGKLGGTGTIATGAGNIDSTLNGVTLASGTLVTASIGTLDLTGTITNGGEFDATTGTIDLENATINGGTLGGAGTIATGTGNTDSTLNGVTIASDTLVTASIGTLDLTGTITNGGEIDAATGTSTSRTPPSMAAGWAGPGRSRPGPATPTARSMA